MTGGMITVKFVPLNLPPHLNPATSFKLLLAATKCMLGLLGHSYVVPKYSDDLNISKNPILVNDE